MRLIRRRIVTREGESKSLPPMPRLSPPTAWGGEPCGAVAAATPA